jgi:molybdate transport system substrate-binding protein
MRKPWILLGALLVLASACSSSGGDNSPGSDATTDLTVFAASSLAPAFTQIGADFEAANPGVHVVFNFAASTDLATQIVSEGTADVFASASGEAMDTVATDPGISGRMIFATNQLVIITPPDNPAGVVSVDSLTAPTVALVVGAEGVPVGDYAREMLANAGIEHAVLTNVVSNEPDDASVVARIAGGDADAGIVYASDLVAAGSSVASIAIPRRINVTAIYTAAVVASTTNRELAQAFMAFLNGPGQATLTGYGFGPPPG